ncbi:hypothetical protein GCM10010302_16680 [Streptomyces polychromogenes]|uniref:Uncharacterized protein n=1 Tax=Streptomyces polychromogenes TaxID=67342 RepID=A0ABP3EWV9_9ACTN
MEPGDAEVEDAYDAVRGYHHVGRLDVPVHDAPFVRSLQGDAHLTGPFHGPHHGGETVGREDAVERPPGGQGHDNEQGVAVPPEVVHGHHMGVVGQAGRGPRLALQPRRRVVGDTGTGHGLHRDLTVQKQILRPPDNAHPPGTKPLNQSITPG